MFPSAGISSAGKFIDGECMIVGGGIKNTPTTAAPSLSFFLIKPRCCNMRQNCHQSLPCSSKQVKSQSFPLEGCVLVRDDLFIGCCTYQGKITYPWAPPLPLRHPRQGRSKETLTRARALSVLPEAYVLFQKNIFKRDQDLLKAGSVTVRNCRIAVYAMMKDFK